MLVLLFDIMEFGIVGGYLSKLCVTLPHMSIGCRIVLAVTFQQIDAAPYAQAATQRNHESPKNIDRIREEVHRAVPFVGTIISGRQ